MAYIHRHYITPQGILIWGKLYGNLTPMRNRDKGCIDLSHPVWLMVKNWWESQALQSTSRHHIGVIPITNDNLATRLTTLSIGMEDGVPMLVILWLLLSEGHITTIRDVESAECGWLDVSLRNAICPSSLGMWSSWWTSSNPLPSPSSLFSSSLVPSKYSFLEVVLPMGR